MESRIRFEHRFYQMTDNMLEFEFKFCVNGALLSICEDGEIIFNRLYLVAILSRFSFFPILFSSLTLLYFAFFLFFFSFLCFDIS